MTTRAEIHRLVDRLPEAALPAAERSLIALDAQRAALPDSLRDVPFADPEPDEVAALAELAMSAPRVGDEEIRRDFGL